jgi:hypothetical protein
MGDHLIYEDAVSTELYTTSEFTSKQYLYVNDNNNGSYSSQIVLDTTSLSNSGYYIGWSESFILMPLVLQFEGADLNATSCYDWVAGMKNGYWQMIHSMTVEFNNRNVVQQVPFLNVFSSFRAMTSWSYADVQNWGAITGFYPDTAESWIYNNVANNNPANLTATALRTLNELGASGIGICNNRNSPFVTLQTLLNSFGASATVGTAGNVPIALNLTTKCTVPNATVRQQFNCGLQKRQSWINFNASPNAGTIGVPFPLYGANPLGYIQVFNGAGTTEQGYIGSLIEQYTSSNQQGILNQTSYTDLFQANITTYTTSSGVGSGRSIVIPAIIRLKDICNFFEKIPLLKGSTMRIYLNTNQCTFNAQYINGQLSSVATTGANVGTVTEGTFASVSLSSAPSILGGGATCPIMLASADLGQGGYNINPLTVFNQQIIVGTPNTTPIPATVQNVTVAISIAKTQFGQLTPVQAGITQCRLYAPAFQMNPLAETRFLELTPTKKVLYNDIFQFYFPNQGAGDNINILVSNGIPNIKSVVVIPLLTSSGSNQPNGAVTPAKYQTASNGANGVQIGAVPLKTSTLLSPFSTTGATPDPIALDNFQILISGVNLFIQNFQYGFEDFYEQVVSINQLNGSLTTGLGSGLVGYNEWQNLYRYYVGNASRIIPSEEGMARSVQIQCLNRSAVNIDLMVFVEYEKSITVNMATGQEIA